MRLRGLVALAACGGARARPGCGDGAGTGRQLIGTVGPGFTITLADANGRLVTQLDPGTYEITVRDLSDEHNFRLFGPGVEEFTQVETTGTVTWTVTFREGRYTVQCDPHSTQMFQKFTVGNPPPVTTTPKPPPVAPTPKLLATVGPKNTISLRSAGGAAAAARRQGGDVLDRRPRPLEAAQLPSRRQGRQPQVDGSPGWARPPGS